MNLKKIKFNEKRNKIILEYNLLIVPFFACINHTIIIFNLMYKES